MPFWAKWGLALLVAVGLIELGWHYVPLLVGLHVMVCIVLIIVIMLQSGSAADLAGAFGGAGSQTAFGPRGAATFLSRATTWCAIVFMLTSLTLSVKRTPTEAGSGSLLEQTQKSGKAPEPAKPAASGSAPVNAPAQAPVQVPVLPPTSSVPAQAPAQQTPPPQK